MEEFGRSSHRLKDYVALLIFFTNLISFTKYSFKDMHKHVFVS